MRDKFRLIMSIYIGFLTIYAIAYLLVIANPTDYMVNAGINGIYYKILLVLIMLSIFLGGMVFGGELVRKRNANAFDKALSEIMDHIVEDVTDVFLDEFVTNPDGRYIVIDKENTVLFKNLLKDEFEDLRRAIIYNGLFPWQKSRPNKRERDRKIWELRQEGYTWEEIAERADCGVSTAKESYNRMIKSG